ncbi:hypothetical protein SO802_010541 [Lithocarpus litseifolius]|uniref:Uncharacterized protein n=1 Tax=Lithocarpus litseifolius TaxID=425828 RepID=A0AAW2DHI5_9ROSI
MLRVSLDFGVECFRTVLFWHGKALAKVWGHVHWQCIMTLNGHDDVVKSLMCWDKYLFSGSLDCTIKVWASTDDGSLEVIYTHSEEQGILALSGMTDPDV